MPGVLDCILMWNHSFRLLMSIEIGDLSMYLLLIYKMIIMHLSILFVVDSRGIHPESIGKLWNLLNLLVCLIEGNKSSVIGLISLYPFILFGLKLVLSVCRVLGIWRSSICHKGNEMISPSSDSTKYLHVLLLYK